MYHISIISASVRQSRNSHRVALFFEKYLKENNVATCEILDLNNYNFPLFTERLNYQQSPSPDVLDFAEKVAKSDGVIFVTPEYNGGYPASLKNVIDLLYKEWQKKPLAISTVSDGAFGGTQVITSLVFTMWKIRAWVVPAMFPVPDVTDAFDEFGNSTNATSVLKRAKFFIDELLWCVKAKEKMKS